MFGRKKKDPIVKQEQEPKPEAAAEVESAPESPARESAEASADASPVAEVQPPASSATESAPAAAAVSEAPARGNRVQKVGIVASDKMQKTVVVRVDRLVMHMKYRRYVRRTTKFKAHNEMGAGVGDRVRIVETRPLSAQKRWRVVEIVQKAAK
jgi:small subunit ribosomal protein S17